MSSPKKNYYNEGLKLRETMFEFLKRKKHSELQKSIKINDETQKSAYKSNCKEYRSSNKKQNYRGRTNLYNDEQQFTLDETIPNFSITQRNNFQHHSSNITPKKIIFSLNQSFQTEVNKNSSRKPLIQMISPLKNQVYSRVALNNQSKRQKSHNKQVSNPKGILKNTSIMKNKSQNYTKKNLNNSLNTLKHVFLTMFQAGKTAKQKSNNLSICLVNLVKDLNLSDKVYSKKLGEIRLILKSIESSLQNFNDENRADELIEEFHLNLAEHLNTIQSVNSEYLRKQLQEKIKQIEENKNQQIAFLEQSNEKLTREIQRYERRIQKIQKQFENVKQQQSNREQNLLETIDKLKTKLQQKQNQYKQQVQDFKLLLQDKTEKNKDMERKIKNFVYSEQKSKKQHQQSTNIQQAARQSYLIQEIERLKQQFSNDIANLHVLYKTKNQERQRKIEYLQGAFEREKHQRECDLSVSNKILEDANIHKNQIIKLTKKNDELLTDLYRMNEELYRHWLAMGDIKKLSERLRIFDNFQRIYKDLAFNPYLFQT